MEEQQRLSAVVRCLKHVIHDIQVEPELPEELKDIEGLEELYLSLLDLRNAFFHIGNGSLDYALRSKGYFAGVVKSLQASLRHLIWQTGVVAKGDFTQSVDFLGVFSDAFNSMSDKLSETINQLAIKENESRESKEHFETIFNSSPDGILISRKFDHVVVNVNEGLVRLAGYAPEELIGKSLTGKELFSVADPKEERELFQRIEETGGCDNVELMLRGGSGEAVTVLMSVKSTTLNAEPHYVVVLRDISERKRTEAALMKSEEMYRLLAENASDVIWVLNVTRNQFVYVSPAVYQLRGFTPEETLKETVKECMHPESYERVTKLFREKLPYFIENPDQTVCIIADIEQPCKDGSFVWAEHSMRFRYNEENEIEIVGVSRNIEERKRSEQEVLYLSHHNHLTGLYNRRFYNDQMKLLDRQDHLPITIISADVNGLKLANDAFGHAAGDMLLKTVSGIMQSCCRRGDLLARVGGDEFLFLLPRTTGEQAAEIVTRIKKRMSENVMENMVLSVSFGWDTKWSQAEDLESVHNRAEDRMYANKLSESKAMKREAIGLIMEQLHRKDPHVKGHCARVSALCRKMAAVLQLGDQATEELALAGRMHDIGKIAIDAQLLQKPGPLSEAEWTAMKRHAEIGYQILRSTDEFSHVSEIVLSHHEHFDGGGYPRGQKGADIPLPARILFLAEAFDAMTSPQPYRQVLDDAQAARSIRENAGSMFDPQLARIFVEDVLVRPWEQLE